MNAVALGVIGRSTPPAGARTALAICVLLVTASSASWAFDESAAATAAAQSMGAPAGKARPQFEISTSSLPRFGNGDGTSRASNLDLSLFTPGRSGLGVSLGLTSFDASPFLTPGWQTSAMPNVDLGLRWRYSVDGNTRVDVTAWRRVPPPDAMALVLSRETSYGARVEMQLGAESKHGFVADHGFLGMQLESGARVGLRRSGRAPLLYYRNNF
jgi:hypothetical protein